MTKANPANGNGAKGGHKQPRVEVRPLTDVLPDDRNVNRHTQRGQALVTKSLQERGAFRSIAAAGKGKGKPVVKAGSLTLQAAIDAGFTEAVHVHTRGDQLVVVVRDDIAPDSAEAALLGIEDNHAAHVSYDPDAAMLAQLAASEQAVLDYVNDDRELAALLKSDGAGGADAEPQIGRGKELQAKWDTHDGQTWQIADHRLLVGDSTIKENIETLMGGEKAQMIFTDPPYGVSFQGKGGDSIAGDTTYALIPILFNLLADVVLDTRAWFYVCGGAMNGGLYAKLFDYHFHTHPKIIVWDKGAMTMRHNAYHSAYEFVYYGFAKGAGDWWFGPRDGEGATDVWRVPKPTNDDREHLTEKPMELPLRAIRNTCPPDGLVVDMFAGVGSTLMAAHNLERRCKVAEISPLNAAIILQRMADAFPGIEIELTAPVGASGIHGPAKKRK